MGRHVEGLVALRLGQAASDRAGMFREYFYNRIDVRKKHLSRIVRHDFEFGEKRTLQNPHR